MSGNILASLLIGIGTKADTSGLNKTERSLKSMGRTAQRVSRQTSLLGKLSRSIFGSISFDTVRNGFMNYLQFEKDVGAMKSRFFAITKDEKQAEEEYKYINDLAIKTANNVKSTADSYSIFYSSAKRALGKEGARGVFEAWTKVGRVLHLNEQQFERVTYALREMSSKGTLYSQDLKMQLGTHVPDAVNIAETAIKNLGISGVDTIEGLQKLTKKNPKSGLMGKFLIEFSKEAEKRFASPEALRKSLQQPDALQQQIANLGWIFANKFSEAGGRDLMVKILTGTYDLLNRLPMDKIVNVLGSIAKFIGRVLNVITSNLTDIISILKDIALALLWTKAFGFIGKAFSFLKGGFFAFKQGKFLKWALLKVVGRELGVTLLKGSIGKAAGALLVNGIPVIGQILSVIMWIWTAVDIIRSVIHIFAKDKGEELRMKLQTAGISQEQFINVAKAIQAKVDAQGGIMSPDEVRKIAGYYIKDKDIQNLFTINDKSQIVVNVDGKDVSIEKALKYDSDKKDKKDKKNNKYNNVPAPNNFKDL